MQAKCKIGTDIFHLEFNDLILLDRMAEKSVNNILHAINKSKNTDLWRFINGLGIFKVNGFIRVPSPAANTIACLMLIIYQFFLIFLS